MQETTARTEQSNRNSEVLQTHTTPEGTVSLTSKHRVPKHCPEHRAELCKVPVPPAAVGRPQHCVAPSVPNAGTQHPTVPHPWRPQGQVAPEAISCAIWTLRGKGRVRGQKPCSGELALVQFPPSLLQPPQVRGKHAPWLLLQHVNSMSGSKLDF